MKNKTVLVTGGAGFIGGHLVNELVRHGPHKIVVVDNFFLGNAELLNESKKMFPNLVVYREDASDYTAMEAIFERENIDLVYNLATKALPYSFIHPEGAFAVNVNIANVLASLLRKKAYKKLIHFSSSEVYGSAECVPMLEDHALHPTTPYAAGKAGADLLLLSNYLTFGIDVSILRPFNNYGPGQNETMYGAVIPITIKRVLQGKKPILEGSGEQTRDFMFVSDTVDAAVKMQSVSGLKGKVVQVCSGKETTIKKVLDSVCWHLGYSGSYVKRPPRPADVKRHFGSYKLAGRLFDWKPKVGFEEGIRKTIEYYRSIVLKDLR